MIILSGALGLFIFTVSLLPAGIVATTFADAVEGDFVTATLEMPDGTTADRTYEVATDLEAAGLRVIERLTREHGDGSSLLVGTLLTVGQGPRVEGGGLAPKPNLRPESHIATIEFKLVGAQDRDLSTGEVAQAWREEVGILPHVRGIVFSGEIIDLGNPIEAVLSHPNDDRLEQIANNVVHGLRGLGGVYDIRSDP